jgi:mono/diheme cytochrome c family protein
MQRVVTIAAGTALAALIGLGAALAQTSAGWWGPGEMGSWSRHQHAMMSGVPAPYAGSANPLPKNAATLARGAAVYAQHCAACHGASGHGDGPDADTLSPPPSDLAWLSALPMSQWDAYMNWTVSEGGVPFGTAMPAFKSTLPRSDAWAAIAYIQSELPNPAPAGEDGR